MAIQSDYQAETLYFSEAKENEKSQKCEADL